jgi:hypothetical protein
MSANIAKAIKSTAGSCRYWAKGDEEEKERRDMMKKRG